MSAFTRRHSSFTELYGFSCWLRLEMNYLGLWGHRVCLLSSLMRGIKEVKIITECWYLTVYMRGNARLTHLPRSKKKKWNASRILTDSLRLHDLTKFWISSLCNSKEILWPFYLTIYKGHFLPKHTSSKTFSPFPCSGTTGNS